MGEFANNFVSIVVLASATFLHCFSDSIYFGSDVAPYQILFSV